MNYKLKKEIFMHFYIFFISDGTGITAESFGQGLLAQFEKVDCTRTTKPYINTPEKAHKLANEIEGIYQRTGIKPLIFSTVIDPAIAEILQCASAQTCDIFAAFMPSLEKILNKKAAHQIGRKRAITKTHEYDKRIEAVHFAVDNDDGTRVHGYDSADIILVGVSRCGKTPTCLYLGLQFGIYAANYPLTEEDLSGNSLPACLHKYKSKLFGLVIDAHRLSAIRQERRPQSQYAAIKQCITETQHVEHIFQHEKIPYIDTTHYSIEEIATRIINLSKIKRRIK